MVRITKTGKEKCAWSGKTADGAWVEFEDGTFTGFMSWVNLKKLLAFKGKTVETKK